MANISKIAVGGTEFDISGVGLIATIETTLTASKTYNVGDQFIYNGLLYIVTQTIASGTAITIGSNCQLAPVVADQLSAINSNLVDISSGIYANSGCTINTAHAVKLMNNTIVCSITFTTTAEVPVWTHMIGLSFAPTITIDIVDTSTQYRMQAHSGGYIQNYVNIPNGLTLTINFIV